LLLLLSLIWGSSFILIKKALINYTALEVASARIGISFIAFLPLLIIKWKEIPFGKIKPLGVIGLCGSGIPAILYSIGQTKIPSGIAGVLNTMTPIFTFLLAIIIFKQKFIRQQMMGITLGFLGVIFLFFTKESTQSVFPYFYGGLIIFATVNYSISANTVKAFLNGVQPLMISIVSFSLIGPFAIVYLFTTDFIPHTLLNGGFYSLSALLVLSLVCTFFANILFFKLIQLTDAVFSTTVSFMIPFVALAWGYFDGEAIGILHLVALLLILGGIILVRKKI